MHVKRLVFTFEQAFSCHIILQMRYDMKVIGVVMIIIIK